MKKEAAVSILYSSIAIAAGILLFPIHTVFAAEEPSSITGYPQYDAILKQYKEGIEAGWDMQTFSDHNLCYLTAYDSDLNHIGYYVTDLDQNGTEELIIGKSNNKEYLGFFMIYIHSKTTMPFSFKQAENAISFISVIIISYTSSGPAVPSFPAGHIIL